MTRRVRKYERELRRAIEREGNQIRSASPDRASVDMKSGIEKGTL